MFLGTHTPKLDEKGRFFLPAKFRDELGSEVVIAKGQERCLAIYTVDEFGRQAAQAMTGPATRKDIRDFQRALAAGASEQAPDKQGRVMIPPALRAYAGLDTQIAVVGAFNRVEVWDLATWESYSAEQDEVFARLDAEVFPGAESRP